MSLDRDYFVIFDARRVLQRFADQAAKVGASPDIPLSFGDRVRLGRVAEAFEAAERAVFTAMNVAANQGDDEQAASVIERWHKPHNQGRTAA
jgi:hypothetical protein